MSFTLTRVSQIISWFFANRCALCNLPSDQPISLCQDCEISLPWLTEVCYRCGRPLTGLRALDSRSITCGRCLQHPPPFARLVACWHYAYPINHLINLVKHQAKFNYALLLGYMLWQVVKENYAGIPLPAAIVPVPLHRTRLAMRGFNQTAEYCRAIPLPTLHSAVVRIQDTRSQAQLSAKSRPENVKHAFECRETLPYQHIAVMDDVITTGNTLSAVCRALHKQNPNLQIDVWCLARA